MVINVSLIPCIENPGAHKTELIHRYIAASWSDSERLYWIQRRRKKCIKMVSDDDETAGGVAKIRARNPGHLRAILWRKGYNEQLFVKTPPNGSWILIT